VILRVAAVLALVLGAAALLAFLHVLGEGPFVSLEASHLRDMKERLDPPTTVEPFTFDRMIALPHLRPVAEYSAIERRGVSLEGYVQHVLRANDGDFHLELVARPLGPGQWDTAYVSAEITPGIRARTASPSGASGWSYPALMERLRPKIGDVTPWPNGMNRVRISGWLLYDWQYDAPWHGNSHPGDRLTGWEIHPVTGIEVWNERMKRFVEVPR
jgi:hypothetical protein